MHIGQKDSVIPDGKLIRSDRLKKKMSQEALVAISERRFSVKTLRRSEKGVRISREKLSYIAIALGFDSSRYLPKISKQPTPAFDCPKCNRGKLVVLTELTKASEGTFSRHFSTKQCSNCGEIISS